jgi:capsular polysaccharide transport system permease protein
MTNISVRNHSIGPIAALRRYFAIIVSLLWREEEARRHAPGEAILNLLEPLGLILMITAARYMMERHAGSPPIGDSILLFYATGFFAKYFFIYVSRRMRGIIRTSGRHFPVEQRLDHIVVHVIMRSIDYSILGVLLFGGTYMFSTSMAYPYDFVPIIEASIALMGLGFGWGIINVVMTQLFWVWAYITPAFNRSLIMFSGIFYIPDFMSEGARYILSFNPILHAIALFRMGFYPSYPDLVLDKSYLAAWVAGSVLFGLVFERITRRS